MLTSASRPLSLQARPAAAVAAMLLDERESDTPGLSLPRPEMHLVVRFGTSTKSGVDVHAMGVRPTRVHRKIVRAGQRTISARLQLGASVAVFGVPASEVTGRIVPLEDLWGEAGAHRLLDELGKARSTSEAAAVLTDAIAARTTGARGQGPQGQLALAAAARLTSTPVHTVATELGVSERHLRRVFLETIGMSPKAFANLVRFHRAVRAARSGGPINWASIAGTAGYYDQAHLIAEFRAIAGATPRALLSELGAALSLG